MEVLQHYNQTRFMGFVPKIKRAADEWYIIEASLTGRTNHNACYIALRLREHFAGKDGIIFICNSKNVLVVVHMGRRVDGESVSMGIRKTLPRHSCTTQTMDTTPEGLVKIQLHLEALEHDNTLLPAASTLLDKRQNRKGRVVMVVDDDSFMRALVRKTFYARSKVIEFRDSKNVLATYLRQLPDIVFLDIHLQGGSGLTLLREIVHFDVTAYVVMCSADSIEANILRARECGAKGFIAKPLALEQLESYYRKCPTVTGREITGG